MKSKAAKVRRAAAVVLRAAADYVTNSEALAKDAWKKKQHAESKMEMRASKQRRAAERKASLWPFNVLDDAANAFFPAMNAGDKNAAKSGRAWRDAEKVRAWRNADKVYADAVKAMSKARSVAEKAWLDTDKLLKSSVLPCATSGVVPDGCRENALATWLKKADYRFDEVSIS